MAEIPQQQGCDAIFPGSFQQRPERFLVPVPPDAGQDGLPLAGKVRQPSHLRDGLQGEGHGGGGEDQQLPGKLLPGGEGHGELRRVRMAARVGDGFLIGKLPPPRHGAAGLRQGGKGPAAELIHRTGGEGQTVLRLDRRALAAVGGAAGLSEPGFQLLPGEGTGAGGFWHGAGDGDGMAIRVRDRQYAGHPRRDGAGEVHGDGAGAVLFTGGSRPGEEVFGLRGVLRPGAEHLRPSAALPVGIREALTGEGGLQSLCLLWRGAAVFPEKAGVDARHHRHILRPFHPALQLETGDAHGFRRLELSGQAVVLQRQGMAPPGGAVQAVRQAAGLGAGPPAAAAATDEGTEIALAGVAHAEGPVGEDLHLGGAIPANTLRVPGGALPGDDHPLAAQARRLAGSAGGEEAHLGAGVEGEVRQGLAQQGEKPPVLHQHRVRPQAGGETGGLQGLGQLPVTEKGVQGQEDPDAPLVAVPEGGREVRLREVPGAAPGVEAAEPQIDRVRTRLDGGAQRLRRPGGGEELRHLPLPPLLELLGRFWPPFRLSSRCWSRKTSRFSSLTSA